MIELPEPTEWHVPNGIIEGYTATQMREFYNAALEAAANKAAEIYQTHRDLYKGRTEPIDKEHWYNPHTDGVADGAGMVEDAIREMKHD